MPAANLPISVEQGATFKRTATMKNSDGSLMDLTGWTFSGQVRQLYDSSIVAASFSFDPLGDQTAQDGSGNYLYRGQITFKLTPSASQALPVVAATSLNRKNTRLIYDIYGNTPGGDSYRLLEGVVSVSPGVTRAGS